ncbi:MAG: CHAT domain-containing protein [Cyanobacteria bacterium P01_A01_bin.17]
MFQIQLYPLEDNPHRFKVVAHDAYGSSEHHEPMLPFFDGEIDRRFTVVKMLEASQFNRQDFDDEDERAWMVIEGLLHPAQDAFQEGWLKTIGQKLYKCLGTDVQSLLKAALAENDRKRTWLHIRFEFPHDASQYGRWTDYPWELIANERDHLAHIGATFSRYIDYSSPRPNASRSQTLHVLLVSSKAGDSRRDLQSLPNNEAEAIASLLANEVDDIHLERLPTATREALRTWLTHHRGFSSPHILHFDGHGYFGRRCNRDGCGTMHLPVGGERCDECRELLPRPQGYLVFEHEHREADYVSARELGEMLGSLSRSEEPTMQKGILLAVLSGCKTGLSLMSDSVFNGMAQNLIAQGIPAVVAMQYSVSVNSAVAFVKDFYRSIGKAESLSVAVRRGQSAMGISGRQWYRPVFYLRWQDHEGGQLFSLSSNQEKEEQISRVAQPSKTMPPRNSSLERLKLIQTLNRLPTTQFEELVTALNPPSGVLPSNFAAQGSRTSVLLQWVEGSTGNGLPELQNILQLILAGTTSDPIPSDRTTPESSPRQRRSSRRNSLYEGRIKELEEELAAVEADLATILGGGDRLRLERKSEQLLEKIEELEAKLD